jgi:hypothetical protein
MILRREKKYLLALKRLSLEEYHTESISVLIPQMMLSKRLEKKAMRFSSMVTTLR